MNGLVLALCALVFPCLLILCVLSAALRRSEPPVPLKTVAAFLGLGLLAVILGEIWHLMAERWLLGRVNFDFYYAFLTASIPEEGLRFLAILYGLRRRLHISLSSAMLLGAVVGLAFATYEHVGYAVLKGWEVWLARSYTSVPYHTLSGAVLGYAAVRWIRERKLGSLGLLAVLMIVHGLGNWPLLDPDAQEPESIFKRFVVSGWAGNIAMLLVVAAIAAALGWKAKKAEAADRPAA